MKTNVHFLIISRSFILRMRNISDKSCRENQNTHFVLSNHFYFFENRADYEIMSKNIVEWGRLQTTIWRMHTACWIPKATNTHSEYVTLIAFPLQQWLHERTSLLRVCTPADLGVLAKETEWLRSCRTLSHNCTVGCEPRDPIETGRKQMTISGPPHHFAQRYAECFRNFTRKATGYRRWQCWGWR